MFLAVILLFSCTSRSRERAPGPLGWTTGFWQWSSSPDAVPSREIDTLYFLAGTITENDPLTGARWTIKGGLPDTAPDARERWMVFRYEYQRVPDASLIAPLVSRFETLSGEARSRGWRIEGIQLDIDSPTLELDRYARFLVDLRRDLPDAQISVTALLDWFRDDTAIGKVISQVDEFVPQFYDLGGPKQQAGRPKSPRRSIRIDGASGSSDSDDPTGSESRPSGAPWSSVRT